MFSDPRIYPTPLTPQQKTDWLDTSPDTPRTNAARENARDLLLECCALERELAEANICERENFNRAEHNLARAEAAERSLSDSINEVERLREALGRIAATSLDIYPGEKSEIAQETLDGKANPNPRTK